MSLSASSAVSSSRAATAATGSPTKRTLSTARACSSWLTGRMPNGIGSSLPTRVATTPGSAAARDTSMPRIRAWGCGERSRRANTIRGRTRSSANSVWPVTLAAASTFGSGWPTTVKRCPSSVTHGLFFHSFRGQLDRFEDLQIAGAAAEVARGRFRDLLPRGPPALPQQRGRREQEAGDAVAALGRAQLGEGLLQRMQRGPVGKAFDGRDLATLAFHGQGEAREDRPAVHEDGAGAALPQLAAVLGPGQAELLAQDLEQRVVDGGQDFPVLAVHPQLDARLRHRPPTLSLPT